MVFEKVFLQEDAIFRRKSIVVFQSVVGIVEVHFRFEVKGQPHRIGHRTKHPINKFGGDALEESEISTEADCAVGIVIVVLTRTFGALVTAMLYFDLRAREGAGRTY